MAVWVSLKHALAAIFPLLPSRHGLLHSHLLDHGHHLLPVHEVVTGELLALPGVIREAVVSGVSGKGLRGWLEVGLKHCSRGWESVVGWLVCSAVLLCQVHCSYICSYLLMKADGYGEMAYMAIGNGLYVQGFEKRF